MTIPRIHENNWNFCHLISGELHAFLSFGAQINAQNECQELYYLNLTQGFSEDAPNLSQQCFNQLSVALKELNQRYQHFDLWDMNSQSSGPGEGGCSTCQAH